MDLAFLVAYAAMLATASLWLVLGLLPGLAAASPALHDSLHRLGAEGRLGGELARNAAQAAHSIGGAAQVTFDYLFSTVNIALSVLIVRLRPRARSGRLLAIGLIGTAVAFNLQGHDALQVVPVSVLPAIKPWHEGIHVVSGLAYVFALLTFPDGELMRRRLRILRVPALVALALFFVIVSLGTVDDHTVGLVVLFGVSIPLAGIASQVARSRRATSADERERSRVVLLALMIALLVAMPLIVLTGSVGPQQGYETVEYELTAPAAGTYYFRCDPHPTDMRGIVNVHPVGQRLINLTSRDSDFNEAVFSLAAGEQVTIRFTNFDPDLHNVALYRDPLMTDPLFVGKEFSGQPSGVAAFRIFRVVLLVVPLALLAALVRFRLWHVNRVVNRALGFALLAGFISVVYIALVAAVIVVFGLAGTPNLAVSVVLTVLVAAIFQPLRDRARRIANVLVYGKRATPYDLLSDFSDRVGSAPDPEHVIGQLARLIGEGTGAALAEVWLRVDQRLVRAATSPEGQDGDEIELDDGNLPVLEGRDRVVPVKHAGHLLGALAVTKPAGDAFSDVEARFLEDAALQGSLALKNVQLNTELRARLEELRASRQRIVAAQDAERRRLERDIHDGAQQHLVALSMKLRMAHDLAARDPQAAQRVLDELQTDTAEALQALRDVARGIHPPVLTDRGLGAALDAHARRCPIPVEVHAEDIGRHDADVETAVYFCCLEAIQNAVKHAGATKVSVELRRKNGALRFQVCDDGRGFEVGNVKASGLANIADRVAALGGRVEISSGRGTTVTGEVPVR